MLRQAAAFSGGLPEKLFASRARVPFPPCLFSHRVSPADLCHSRGGAAVLLRCGVVATASTSALCHGSAPDHSASCHRRLMKVSRCHEGEQAAAPLLAKRKRSQSKAQPKGKAKPKAKAASKACSEPCFLAKKVN